MTINIADNTPRVSYSVAEGVTQTSFTVSFEFFDAEDLNVYVDNTLKTLTTDYTVTGGDGNTGSISISVTGASGGSTVVITRDIALERTTDFPLSGSFQIQSLNTELDRITAIAADLDDHAQRGLRLQDSDAAASTELPLKADRLGKTLAFNATTGAVEAGPTIADTQSVADASADIATLADIQDGTVATNAITTAANISSNITTVAGIASNVSTVAGISSDVTAVAADATDIGTVATNIASVNTVAGNISEVIAVANDLNEAVSEVETVANDLNEAVSEIETVATSITNVDTVGANIGNVNTVAGISSNVTTVAGISANVTTVAGISSNVTTVAGISSDVTAVAADATDIGTVATNIANVNAVAGNATNINSVVSNATNINTVAGISSDVTAVAADATDIGTVATNLAGTDTIGTVATNISNVNTVAGISANVTTVAGISSDVTAVAADATDIGTVATNIANVNSVGGSISNVNTVATNISSVNDFADKYRVGASDPTTNNDEGDLFYNTTSDTLKVYTGTAWEQGVTAGSGFLPTTGGSLTGNVTFGDNNKAIFGAGSDLQIYHDGVSTSYIKASSDLFLQGTDDVVIRDASTLEEHIRCNLNDSVEISYDGSVKLATTSTGINVTGTTYTDGIRVEDDGSGSPLVNIRADDGNPWAIRIANDTYSTGNNDGWGVYVQNTGTATHEVRGNGAYLPMTFIQNNGSASREVMRIGDTGYFRALYQGSTRLDTTSAGINVTGTVTADGVVVGDSEKIQLGNSQDFQMYHDGSNSFIDDAGTGNIYLRGSSQVIIGNMTGEQAAVFNDNGAVTLNYDNAQKLATTSGGCSVTGTLEATTVDLGNWTITETSGVLYFATGGVNKMKLDASGNLTVVGDVTAFGTV